METTPGIGRMRGGDQLEQMGVALANHLREDVEAAGRDDHVVDLLDGRERLRHGLHWPSTMTPIMA